MQSMGSFERVFRTIFFLCFLGMSGFALIFAARHDLILVIISLFLLYRGARGLIATFRPLPATDGVPSDPEAMDRVSSGTPLYLRDLSQHIGGVPAVAGLQAAPPLYSELPSGQEEPYWKGFLISSRGSAIASAAIPAVVGAGFSYVGFLAVKGGIASFLAIGMPGDVDAPAALCGLIGILTLLWVWRRLVRFVYEIIVSPDGTMIMRRPFASRVVEAKDIRAIRTFVVRMGMEGEDARRLRISLTHGSVTVNYSPTCDQLIERLLVLNPGIRCERGAW